MPGARGDGNRHRGGRSLRRPVRPTARRLPEPERAVPRGSLPLQQGGRRPRSPRLPDGGKTQRLATAPQSKRRIKRGTLHIQQQQNKTKQNKKKKGKREGVKEPAERSGPFPMWLGRGDAVASRALGSPLHGTTLQRGTVAQAEKPTGRTGFGACGCHPERGHRGGPGPGVRPAGARGCPPELAALLPARRPGCPGARVTPPSATRGI
ncbi:uncharacterized protein LOC130148333 isoform X2 [Falco biarmicus]|uniref:uncharacterized protein LOC130148333 isoform X2 n=1 Tax=Falco biarmicus TaxID=345155 RepID=UPI0024BC6E66|nr:uncharacterized protein LOC130148333 isoform X2 [Falco biarmicus]